jgi:hypothetical protein
MAKLNSGTQVYGNLIVSTFITATGNIYASNIGINTSTPSTELSILAATQTASYTIGGNSTTQGTDIHITGANASNTRITQDAFGTGSYVAFTGRAGRGTAATPTQTISSDTLAQFTARGFSNGTLQFGNVSTGRIDIVAAENFTDTSRATNVQIYTTAAASIAPTAIATFSSASGLSVAGNITSSNIITAGTTLSQGYISTNWNLGALDLSTFGGGVGQSGRTILGWNRSGGGGELSIIQNKDKKKKFCYANGALKMIPTRLVLKN